MTGIRLREAAPGDAPAIAALHAANWRGAYANVLDPAYLAGPIDADRLAVWSKRLSDPPATQEVVLAEDEGDALAGFVCLYHREHPVWGGFVDNLHSAAAVRGRGVGTALLREAARRIAARDADAGLWLWVFEKNSPARGFYEALGARIVEQVVSDWDIARGEMRLRCHWPDAARLAAEPDPSATAPSARCGCRTDRPRRHARSRQAACLL
ncbi:GNAT family N-acetyltransferase [Pelagerythrobacter sp.]|uniref:GNAT family N-acetyltransferase n=1 Tax=Pelagerythrobacter sp. TaxID=2800702 RepID=UPI0035B12CCA